MLLEYQKNNLNHLEQALQNNDTITIIGKEKSGRKTVVSKLKFDKSIIINIKPYTNQYSNCSDFLTAIKDVDNLTNSSLEISPGFSFGDIFSISIERTEIFVLEKHLIKNVKKASKKHKIVLIIEDFINLDNGTKEIVNKIRSEKIKSKLKKGLITIFIPDSNEKNISDYVVGKEIYFDRLTYDNETKYSIFKALNLNPDIELKENVMDFILKNSDGNIEMISSIINDINHKQIDYEFELLDYNNNIKNLVNSKINSVDFDEKLKYALTVISIRDNYFSNLDLSFLLSEEINIIDYYMEFATKCKYVYQTQNCYSILFGIIKKIFSTIPQNQKIKIYNDIVNLIDTYYPNQYQEKYFFANLSKNPKAKTYLFQAIFKQIREEGLLQVDNLNLSIEELSVIEEYFRAYSKAINNNYKESIEIIDNFINKLLLSSPLKEEFLLLKSQCLIKSIDERNRQEAIEILSYDEKNENIDEYLKYRIETRKIAALIHNGKYKEARVQSEQTENKFINIISETHSPGIEYYLNIIYRKYSNIHSYESSIIAINKSIEFFSNNSKYIKEAYISLNNALALNLINGNNQDALKNIKEIENLKERQFNYRFPRYELFENNYLIYQLINEGSDDLCHAFERLYKKTKESADNIFICSNYAISLAFSNKIEKAFLLLKEKYNDPCVINDKEGVYKFRIFCNYAILGFLLNKGRKKAIKILQNINIAKEDVHYSERVEELNTIIKTINNIEECDSVQKWVEAFKSNVHTVKNYYCLYQQGFVFTTLFDWDDE